MLILSSTKAWLHHPGKRVMRRSVEARAAYNRIARIVKWRTSAKSRQLLTGVDDRQRFEIKQDDGYATFGVDTIAPTSDVVAAASALFRSGTLQREGSKTQLITYPVPIEGLSADSAYLRFALDPVLLSGVARYFGTAPILTYIAVWESRSAAGSFNSSQLFHCDFEDQTQMKVFVFCSDVTMDHGPLTVVSARDSRTIADHVRYSFNKASSYRVNDDDVASAIPRTRWHALMGPPGTVALVDTTRCFHFGSRVTGADSSRLMAVFQYVTPFAFEFPLFFDSSLPFEGLASTGAWSPIQRFALSGK